MKPGMKALILTVSLAVGIPVVAWVSTFLYWHFTITNALRTMKLKMDTSEMNNAAETLFSSGCRGLPYAFGELSDDKHDLYQSYLTFYIAWQIVCPGMTLGHQDGIPPEYRDEWAISHDDPPERRRQKCRALRAWWKEHGSEAHQGWRVWSGACGEFRPPDGRK